jgi:hypothetical protein
MTGRRPLTKTLRAAPDKCTEPVRAPPVKATLHKACFVNPRGRAAVDDTKRSFSVATGEHFTKCGVM